MLRWLENGAPLPRAAKATPGAVKIDGGGEPHRLINRSTIDAMNSRVCASYSAVDQVHASNL
jgi:hypothetical protein